MPKASHAEFGVLGRTIHDADGRPVRRTGILLDISDRKAAEQRIRDSEERLRLALASGNLGTWLFDTKAKTIEFDQLAAAIFGVEPDHPTGLEKFKAQLHPEDHAVFDRELKKLSAGSDTLDVEYRLPQCDGSVRWVQISGTIDREANLDRQQLIGVVADVTEQHKSDERLRSAPE